MIRSNESWKRAFAACVLFAGWVSIDGARADPPQTLPPHGFESTDQLQQDVALSQTGPFYSVWLIESSRYVDVPFGSFMPDRTFIPGSIDPRHNIPFIDFPVNVGVILAPDGQITLFDTGWKQLSYVFDWNTSCCWADLRNQLTQIGLDPNAVTRIILGHGHWDAAGQIDSFPNATLYIQSEELGQIKFFLNYPAQFNGGHIRAVNTVDPITGAQVGPPQQACARSPVCGYPPQTVSEILGKVQNGRVILVLGRMEVAPGLIIHPAFRAHTYGSQLLQVNTTRGQLVFGGGAYSSWEGLRDWNVANIQQTDTIQQFLAYEKCYVLTTGQNSFNNCIAGNDRLSYSADYPITQNWWTITNANCSRAAELALAPGQASHVPANVATGNTTINGHTVPWRIDPVVCRNTVSIVPPHTIVP